MFLVVGESLVDVVDGREHPGGSPLNVAVGLGRLGLDVTFVTSVGNDAAATLIRDHLDAANVRVQATTTARTSTAVATLDPSGAADYTFDVTWDPGTVAPAPGVTALHVGSIAATLLPGADDVARLADQLYTGAVISFDPNVRPGLITDRGAASARIEHLASLADVVKVSDEDLAWLHPDVEPAEVAARWLAGSASIVVVTRGAAGATAYAASGQVDVATVPVDVVDSVGAGDAFMSGLLAALQHDGLLAREALRALDPVPLERVISVAVRSAAITVGRAGATPPTGDELWPPATMSP